LVSLDSKSLYHEAKAAGMIYQATLRHLLHSERGFEWTPVDPHSGMAEIAGITREDITAWSRRSTRLREWAAQNLVVVDGEPTAAQLAAAQKATRPTKPEALAWEELKAQWRADARRLLLDRDAHHAARTERTRDAHGARAAQQWARVLAQAAHIDKAAFTRADMVEPIAAHLPVDTPREPLHLVESSPTGSGCASAHPGQHTNAKDTRSSPSTIKEEEHILDRFSKHVLTEPCECIAYLNGRPSLDVEWDVDEQRCSTADGTLDCHLPAERLDAVDQTGQP
jgi:hypothetical protein